MRPLAVTVSAARDGETTQGHIGTAGHRTVGRLGKSFENSLVTAFAAGTTLTGNATLLSQFEALYTSSPTTQQTTDLTAAYNALAAAVTSANITSAQLTTINTDWAAVLAAEGSTSTATYPYFNLVTGQVGHGGRGC